MTHKPSSSEGPLFHPFDPSPPPGDVCLENVYAAFAGHAFVGGWCTQCFTPENEATAQQQNVRTAAAETFDPIYFEHPYCSGGPETFLHFLPRGLELSCFDGRLFQGFGGYFLRMGVLAWPESEQSALRDLFCRVAVSWFVDGHTGPLEGPTHETNAWILETDVPELILQALLVLRIDPKSLAEWLLAIDTSAAWHGIAKVLKERFFVEKPVYFVLDEEKSEADYTAACEALNRRCRAGFQQVITDDVLLEKWLRLSEAGSEPKLAELISKLEYFLSVGGGLKTGDLREDEELIRKVVARR